MGRIPAKLLPAAATAAIVATSVIVIGEQPDRALAAPDKTPPTAPAGRAIVAGAGVIEPASELIEVVADVPGVVDQVFVAAGDRVAAGAPLFSVDSRTARANLQEAEARVARLRREASAARTALAIARRQYALYEGAGDPRAVSRQDVIARGGAAEDAAAQVAVADAAVREAEAQRDSERVTLARHIVRAPRAATVLRLRTRPGQYAPAGLGGDALVTLGDTDPLHVRLDIDENEIGRLALGRPAMVSPRGDAGRRVEAVFVRAEPLVVPKRSLTNEASERVDVRVLQLIFRLPRQQGWFVGQQVDGFVPARSGQ